MASIDRASINQALGKAVAYKACGSDAKANYWAGVLVQRLQWAGIEPEVVETEPFADNVGRWATKGAQ